MSVITQETVAEQRAVEAIQERLRGMLESNEMSVEEVAERLGLVPEGVRSLLLRKWSFETAFRVAVAMDFDFVEAIRGE
jgi:hypothetical protein